MNKFIPIIKNNALFTDILEDELEQLLICLQAKITDYKKGQYIWMQGDENYKVGIVVEGKANIIKDDFMGNRSLIAGIEPTEIFGESIVSSEIVLSPVSVQAATDSKIMLIDFYRIVKSCSSACEFHTRLVQNMMKIIAKKNIYLNEKIDYLKRTTTRQKVSAYILDHLNKKNITQASIRLNREELADYLGVNRSALSRELSKMKKDGLIDYNKNLFIILDYTRMADLAS